MRCTSEALLVNLRLGMEGKQEHEDAGRNQGPTPD